jgi:hypothetical protein
VPDERVVFEHVGGERRLLELHAGREDHVIGRQGPGPRARRAVAGGLPDRRLDVVGVDVEADRLTLDLDEVDIGIRLRARLGDAIGQVVVVDPAGRRPVLDKREVRPRRAPAAAVGFVIGPADEVVDVLAERRHPTGLDVEHVIPGVAVPVVCHARIPVVVAALKQEDLERLAREPQEPDGGCRAGQSGADDEDSRTTHSCLRVGCRQHASTDLCGSTASS